MTTQTTGDTVHLRKVQAILAEKDLVIGQLLERTANLAGEVVERQMQVEALARRVDGLIAENTRLKGAAQPPAKP